jgi:hypothetical protein
MADGALTAPALHAAAPDLRARIRAHYGSLAKLAARVGIHKSTLGRVLAGTYPGDAAAHERRILQQLRADGVPVDLPDLPALADLGLAAVAERLDALHGAARLARRQSRDAPVQAALDLIAAELRDLRTQLGGRGGHG